MSKKEKFIEFVKQLMDEAQFDDWDENVLKDWSDALDFWNGLQISENDKPKFTENGKIILSYLKENKEVYNNLFKAKEVGEGIGISSRRASGAMRKLVTDGYIEKIGDKPAVYALTVLGDETDPNAEE